MVHATALPPRSFLRSYQGRGYTDCYVTTLPFSVTAPEFIEAFYTTPLFKLERWLLGALLRRPSTDAQARELALGRRQHFAAWSVESRDEHQAILAAGRTRSWLSVGPHEAAGTRLFFGSAVVPRRSSSGADDMGFWFRALRGFHKLYSQALLRSASARLRSWARAGALPGRAP